MVKINLIGSVEDEFVKMAVENGWMDAPWDQLPQSKPLEEQSEGGNYLTPEQKEVALQQSVAPAAKAPVVRPQVKKAPVAPVTLSPSQEVGFQPKLPDWADKDPYDTMVEKLPKWDPNFLKGLDPSQIAKETEKEYQKVKGTPWKVEMTQKGDDAENLPQSIPDTASLATAASVINELISLANDLEDMGDVKTAMAVDKQINIYKKAINSLYDVTGETGDEFINQTHPKGGVTVVPAKDEGGKIETIVEQHKKILDKVNKNPTGKYAKILSKLIATANKLDDEGDAEAAKLVDKTIASLRKKVLPFVDRSASSEAVGSYDVKASIKVAEDKRFVELLPLWDDIINNYWNPLYTEIFETMPSIAETLDSQNKVIAESIRMRYKLAKEAMKNAYNNWHNEKVSVGQLSKYISSMVTALNFAKENNMDSFKYFHSVFTRASVAAKYSKLHDALINKLFNLANNLKAYSKEAPKDDLEQVRKAEYNKYIATLDKIIKAVSNGRRELLTAYGNKDDKIVDKYINAFTEEKELAKKYTWKQLQDGNDAVYNKLIPFLKQYKINVANKKFNFVKTSAGIADLLKNLPGPTKVAPKTKTAPKTKGTAKQQSDPEITKLQNALAMAGFDIGHTGPDGKWGPNTLKAYNRLIEKAQEMAGERKINLFPITDWRRQKPTTDEIDKIVRWAELIKQEIQKTISRIEFTIQGTNFDSRDLETTSNFLEALKRNGLITDYSKLDKNKIIPIVEKNIKILWQDLNGNQGRYIVGTYGQQSLTALKDQLKVLWTSFSVPDWSPVAKEKSVEEMMGVPGKPGKPGQPGKPGASGVVYTPEGLIDPFASKQKTMTSPGTQGPSPTGQNFFTSNQQINVNSVKGIYDTFKSLWQTKAILDDAESFKYLKDAPKILQKYEDTLNKASNALAQRANEFATAYNREEYQNILELRKDLYQSINEVKAVLARETPKQPQYKTPQYREPQHESMGPQEDWRARLQPTGYDYAGGKPDLVDPQTGIHYTEDMSGNVVPTGRG